jgi:hypothetical protein
MNWNEHILSIKAEAEKNHQMLSPHQMGGRSRKPFHYTKNDNTKHIKIRRRALRLSVQSSAKKSRKNPQPRNKIRVFAVCRTDNALCKAGVSKLTDMRNLNTTITTIKFISNPNHPIRPYCLNLTKLKEYALRPAAPKPLFVQAMEYLGKLQINTKKI